MSGPIVYKPDYVERGGEQVWRPPGSARDVELYGFVLPAERACIDALLTRDFTGPSRGAVDYRCAHPSVIVTFGAIGRESSLDPVDRDRGFFTEFEVSIWCLVADARRHRLLWYLPYVYTDSEQTVATGREIFGYPKQLGYFSAGYPASLQSGAGATTLTALGIPRFAPTAQAQKLEMLRVDRIPSAEAPGLRSDIEAALLELFPGGFSLDPAPVGPGAQGSLRFLAPGEELPAPQRGGVAPWITGIFNAIGRGGLSGSPAALIAALVADPTLVFLKQFRDATCATKACYQAVIEAPLTVELDAGSRYQPLDPSRFTLTLQDHDSDPIASDLGLPADTPLQPTAAFATHFGFNINLGVEVWKAST